MTDEMRRRAFESYVNYLVVERGLSPNTVEAYRRDLLEFLAFLEDRKLELSQAERQDLFEYVRGLHQRLSVSSIMRKIVSLRSFYRFLLLDGYVDKDPTETLESPKLWRRLPVYLEPDEVERLLEGPDLSTPYGLRDRTMLEVLYATGLRVTELVQIRVREVSLEAGFLRTMGKGSKERLVPMGNEAADFVDAYQREARPYFLRKRFSSPFLFLTRRGGPMTRQNFWKLTRNYGKRAAIDGKLSPSRAAPQLCHSPAGKWRRLESGPGDAGACRHLHHPDLYPRQPGAPEEGLQQVPSPGLNPAHEPRTMAGPRISARKESDPCELSAASL